MTEAWLWNVGLPAWVPVFCRVAFLRRGEAVPQGTWVRVVGRLYVSDRRPWMKNLREIQGTD